MKMLTFDDFSQGLIIVKQRCTESDFCASNFSWSQNTHTHPHTCFFSVQRRLKSEVVQQKLQDVPPLPATPSLTVIWWPVGLWLWCHKPCCFLGSCGMCGWSTGPAWGCSGGTKFLAASSIRENEREHELDWAGLVIEKGCLHLVRHILSSMPLRSWAQGIGLALDQMSELQF